MLVAETCFPVEVVHGHVQDLLEGDADYIFMPFIVDNEAEAGNPTLNYNCPWIQTYPFMIRGARKGEEQEKRFLTPTLHFRYSRQKLVADLAGFMSGPSAPRLAKCAGVAAARKAQTPSRAAPRRLPDPAACPARWDGHLGRPYNTGTGAEPRLAEKLIDWRAAHLLICRCRRRCAARGLRHDVLAQRPKILPPAWWRGTAAARGVPVQPAAADFWPTTCGRR
jgi:hypothetical protein